MTGQLFINELKCSFNLRQPKVDKPTNIYLVARINNTQVKLSTGVKVYPEHWNEKKQEAYISVRLSELDNNNNIIANDKLTELKASFVDFKHYICEHPTEIDNGISLLKNHIYKDTMSKQAQKINAIHWLNRALAEDQTIKESSKRDYISQIRGFEKFLKDVGKYPISFDDINLALMKDYEAYLFKKVVEAGKTTKTSTVGNKIEKIIAILKRAESYELIDMHEAKIDRYKKPLVKEDGDNEVYLTEVEIEAMYKLSLTGKEEIARDLFVLQCWTGQRFSDIQNLSNAIVRDAANGKVLEIIQTKKNHKVTIPLLPVALEILNKYDYKLPSIDQTTMLKYIKQAGKKSGITRLHNVTNHRGDSIITEQIELYKLIGTHTARRSFISNMLKRGYDSHILMKITGHSTEEAFKKYAKLSSEDAANTVLNIEAGKTETVDIVVPKITPKVKVLDYLFAESTLLKLDELHSKEVNIYELSETHRAIKIVKNISTTDKAKAFLDSIDKTQFYERINKIGEILWYIGRRYADPILYQIYEQKVIELGLSDSLNQITDADVLNQLWQQEYYNEQECLE